MGVLDRLLKRIRRVRTVKFQSSEWFLFHDNAPSHNAAIVKKFLANRKVAVLHHPPYSPDLAPANYFLFPKFKFPLKWRHFQTVWEIQFAVTRELNNISKTAFPGGHEEVEGTCKQMYWSKRNVFRRIKINYVHVRRYLCFITLVLKLLGLTLYIQSIVYTYKAVLLYLHYLCIRRAQVEVGLINLCKGLCSLNARIYYKLKSGT